MLTKILPYGGFVCEDYNITLYGYEGYYHKGPLEYNKQLWDILIKDIPSDVLCLFRGHIDNPHFSWPMFIRIRRTSNRCDGWQSSICSGL